MFDGQSILCFAPSDWWGMNPSCTTHLMKRFAGQNKVLYVNPFSSDMLGVTKTKKRGFAVRFWRKFKSLAKWIRKVDRNLYVFSPLFIPIQGKPWLDRFNNLMLYGQIRLACCIAGVKKPTIWLENLRAADLLNYYKNAFVLYHVSDLFTHDGYVANPKVLQRREQLAFKTANVVICASTQLFKLCQNRHTRVNYQPHGVEFERFYQASKSIYTPPELQGIPHPIAGYFGTLTGSNNIALWERCATSMPGVSFVFVGRITGGDYSVLLALPNVKFLGPQPYERIPAICAGFDLCMLQWKMCPWIKSCNPLKMFEYMASGKPIVSVAIEEAKKYSDCISIAETEDEFIEKIRWELDCDTVERKLKRIEIARRNDWSVKLRNLSLIIEDSMKERPHNN